jgi:hypothetical protein
MLEFNASIVGRDPPIGLGVAFVTVSFPGSDFCLNSLRKNRKI